MFQRIEHAISLVQRARATVAEANQKVTIASRIRAESLALRIPLDCAACGRTITGKQALYAPEGVRGPFYHSWCMPGRP